MTTFNRHFTKSPVDVRDDIINNYLIPALPTWSADPGDPLYIAVENIGVYFSNELNRLRDFIREYYATTASREGLVKLARNIGIIVDNPDETIERILERIDSRFHSVSSIGSRRGLTEQCRLATDSEGDLIGVDDVSIDVTDTNINVYCLIGYEVPTTQQLSDISDFVNEESRRIIDQTYTLVAPTAVTYAVEVDLEYFARDTEPNELLINARRSIYETIARQTKLGSRVTRRSLSGGLAVPGVVDITYTKPSDIDIGGALSEYPRCPLDETNVVITATAL